MITTPFHSSAARECANSVGHSRQSSLHAGMRAAIACGSSLIAAFCLVPRAHADAATAAPDQGGLTEIVVTAEKFKSTIQDTPISISALSCNQLEAQGITSVEDIARDVPGISVRSAGPGLTEYDARGLASNGGAAPTVGFYLDEIPLSPPALSQSGKVVIDPGLYDVDRVEVLRGPQGTLYGSGSMGGTVKVVTDAAETQPVRGFGAGHGVGNRGRRRQWQRQPDAEPAAGRQVGAALGRRRPLPQRLDQSDRRQRAECRGHAAQKTRQPDAGLQRAGRKRDPARQLRAAVERAGDTAVQAQRGSFASAVSRWISACTWAATTCSIRPRPAPRRARSTTRTTRCFRCARCLHDDVQIYGLTINANLGFADLTSATSYFTRHNHAGQDASESLYYSNGGSRAAGARYCTTRTTRRISSPRNSA